MTYNIDFLCVLIFKIVGITGIAVLLEFCYRKGNILHWYYSLLEELSDSADVLIEYAPRFYLAYIFRFVTKPLGLCYLCQNFWIQLLFLNFYGVDSSYYPCVIGFSYFILLIYNKHND